MTACTYAMVRDRIIDTPAGNGKAVSKTLALCNKELACLEHRLARQQLAAAHRQVRWKCFDMTKAWQHLQATPLKDLSGVARVAILRMVLNREADDKLRWYGTPHQGDHGECMLCTRLCRFYPHGRTRAGACAIHASLDTWWLASLPQDVSPTA